MLALASTPEREMSKFNQNGDGSQDLRGPRGTPQGHRTPQTIHIPRTPQSCPPVSPITRISLTPSDNVSSPGRTILSFELDGSIDEDKMHQIAQTVTNSVRELSLNSTVDEEDPIPPIKLQAPPKGKRKRQLSSDSDSHSSTSATSALTSHSMSNSSLIGQNSRHSLSLERRVSDVTTNQNAFGNRSDASPRLQRTPEGYLFDGGSKSSPKKFKPGALAPAKLLQLGNDSSPRDFSFCSYDDQSPSSTPKPLRNSTPNFDSVSQPVIHNESEDNLIESAFAKSGVPSPIHAPTSKQKALPQNQNVTSYPEQYPKDSSNIFKQYSKNTTGMAVISQNEPRGGDVCHLQFGSDIKIGQVIKEGVRKKPRDTEPDVFKFPDVSIDYRHVNGDEIERTAFESASDEIPSRVAQPISSRSNEATSKNIPDHRDEVDGLDYPMEMEMENQQSRFGAGAPFGSHLGYQSNFQATHSQRQMGFPLSSPTSTFSSPVKTSRFPVGKTQNMSSVPANPFSFQTCKQSYINSSRSRYQDPVQQSPPEIETRVFSESNRYLQRPPDQFWYPSQHPLDGNRLDDYDYSGSSKQSWSLRNSSYEAPSRARNTNERIVVESEEVLDISEPDDVVHILDRDNVESSQRAGYRSGSSLNFRDHNKMTMDQNNNSAYNDDGSPYIVQTKASTDVQLISLDELSGSSSSMSCGDEVYDDPDFFSKGSEDCIPLDSHRSHRRLRCDEMDGVFAKNKTVETKDRKKTREIDIEGKGEGVRTVYTQKSELRATVKTAGHCEDRLKKNVVRDRVNETGHQFESLHDTRSLVRETHFLGVEPYENRLASEPSGLQTTRPMYETAGQDKIYRDKVEDIFGMNTENNPASYYTSDLHSDSMYCFNSVLNSESASTSTWCKGSKENKTNIGHKTSNTRANNNGNNNYQVYHKLPNQRQNIASEKRSHITHRTSPYAKNKVREARRRPVVDAMEADHDDGSGDEVDGLGDDAKNKGRDTVGKEEELVNDDKAGKDEGDDGIIHCFDETDGDSIPPTARAEIDQRKQRHSQQSLHARKQQKNPKQFSSQTDLFREKNITDLPVNQNLSQRASGPVRQVYSDSELREIEQREKRQDQRQHEKISNLQGDEIWKSRLAGQSGKTEGHAISLPIPIKSTTRMPPPQKAKKKQAASSETSKDDSERGDDYKGADESFDYCRAPRLSISCHGATLSVPDSSTAYRSGTHSLSCSASAKSRDQAENWFRNQSVFRCGSDGQLDARWNRNSSYGDILSGVHDSNFRIPAGFLRASEAERGLKSSPDRNSNVSYRDLFLPFENNPKQKEYRSFDENTHSDQHYGARLRTTQERGRQTQSRRRGSDAGVISEVHRRRSDNGLRGAQDIPRARSSPSKLGETSPKDSTKKQKQNFFRPWDDSSKTKQKNSLGSLNLDTSYSTHRSPVVASREDKLCNKNIPSHSTSLPCGDPAMGTVFASPSVSQDRRQSGVEKSPSSSRKPQFHLTTHSDPKREQKHSTAEPQDRNSKSASKQKIDPQESFYKTISEHAQDMQGKYPISDGRKTNRRLDFQPVTQENQLVLGAVGGASIETLPDIARGGDVKPNRGVDSDDSHFAISSVESFFPKEQRRQDESTRNLNEVDIRVEVSDVLDKTRSLGQLLDQIEQSNDRSCQCARIEQEILNKARQMFGYVGSNPSRQNWLVDLHRTNQDVEDALKIALECRQLCRKGRKVTDIQPGSVIIKVKCPTLAAVVDLSHMQESGDLQMVLLRIFSGCLVMKDRGITLKVGLCSKSVERCKKFFLKPFEIPKLSSLKKQSYKKTSPSKGVVRSKENLLTSPRSPLSPLFLGPDRSNSTSALNLRSPLTSPMSVNSPATPTSRRSRNSSLVEIDRKAFQELNISDSEPQQSSSKEDVFTSSEKSLPRLLSPNHLTSPRRLTSPTTSPLSSPRRLARHDVIQEQENV